MMNRLRPLILIGIVGFSVIGASWRGLAKVGGQNADGVTDEGSDGSEDDFEQDGGLKKVRIGQGSSVTLQFRSAEGLKVSRKGVVNLFHKGKGIWSITGLRRGLVVLEGQRPQGVSAIKSDKRYLVEVLGERPSTLPLGILPDWICQRPGVQCDQTKRVIAGTAPSIEFWVKSYTHCRKLAGCEFKIELSSELRKVWQFQIAGRMGHDVELRILDNGAMLVLGDCSRNSIAKLEEQTQKQSGVGTLSGVITVGCLEDYYRGLFQVSIDVISVKESSSQRTGMEAQENFVIQGGAGHGLSKGVTLGIDGALFSRLVYLMAKDKAKVVAQPVVRMMSSTATRLVSGGEFATKMPQDFRGDRDHPKDDVAAAVDWKALGLELGLEVFPLSRDKVNLKYDSSLKTKIDQGSLQVQSLKGSVELPLGQKVLIGRIDMNQLTMGDQGSLLSHIPIIGALFKSSHQEAGKSAVFLWASIERISDK